MKLNLFKSLSVAMLLFVMLGFSSGISAQAIKALPDTSKMTYNEISQKMKLYVFPAKSQTQQKQKEDEFECYKWAADQSGVDPLNPPKVEAAPVQSGPNGAVVGTAAKGAAAHDDHPRPDAPRRQRRDHPPPHPPRRTAHPRRRRHRHDRPRRLLQRNEARS